MAKTKKSQGNAVSVFGLTKWSHFSSKCTDTAGNGYRLAIVLCNGAVLRRRREMNPNGSSLL